MSETNYFGLQKVEAGESLAINDYAFTTRNLDRIDLALYRAQVHEHTGAGAAIENPSSPPSLTLENTGGNIPAGVTARYVYTWVDEFGAETAPSPEYSVTTPAPIEIPLAPGITRTSVGGTLLPGNYFYALAAYVGANTTETPAGDRAYTTVPTGTTTNLITLNLPSLPEGAEGFNVYRRAPGEGVYSYLTSIDMTVATPPTTFEDDGSIMENCNRQPSNVNLTNASNSITVTLPGATPLVPEDYTWRVYRTYSEDNFSNSLLSWVVEETSEGSGIITPEFVDIGSSTSAGQPPAVSEMAPMPSKISLVDHVEPSLPPGYVPQAVEVSFAFPGDLVPQEGSFVWTCTWPKAKIKNVVATLGRDSYPVADPVIVDVNKYDVWAATPTWESIFALTADQPTIEVDSDNPGWGTPTTVDLFEGDKLSVDIDQTGGGATPMDHDLIVTISMYVATDVDWVDNTPDPTTVEFADFPET